MGFFQRKWSYFCNVKKGLNTGNTLAQSLSKKY